MEEFHRIRRLPPYVFEQVNRAKAAARNAGADIIDLGMGNPDLPAPAHVIEKLKDTVGKPRTDRYSASKGIAGLRRAQAAYYGRRFGVKLNPESQIVATLGSKGGLLSRMTGMGDLAGAGGVNPALLGGGGGMGMGAALSRREVAQKRSGKRDKRKQARKARKKNRKR